MSKFLSVFLTIIFVLQSCVMAQIAPGEIKITVNLRNPTLENVFENIEKQTPLTFYYKNNVVEINRPISIPLVNITVDKAMKLIFAGKYVKWIYEGDSAVLILKAEKAVEPIANPVLPDPKVLFPLPSAKLSGQVVNAEGNPIANASVFLKDMQKGAITNNKGRFNFKDLPHNAVVTLFISSLGYERKECKVVVGQTPVQLFLDSSIEEMHTVEVFAAGYENIPREKVTGSFAILEKERFNEQVGTDVLSRLPAIANGLSSMPPGIKSTGIRMMIRGLSTFGGSMDPLIMVDDFPYNGDLQDINPNDVERISILKDAAATAILGTTAGNGVVLITTKKGKYNQPLRVMVNANFTVSEKPDLFSIKAMSAGDLVDAEKYFFENGYYDERVPYPAYASFTPVVSILLKERQGELSGPEAAEKLDRLRNRDVRNDMGKYFYRRELRQQYAIQASWGTEKHHSLFSAGFDNNRSVLNEQYRRYTMRVPHAFKVNNKLELITNLFFTQSERKSGAPAFTSFKPGELPIYTELINESGKQLPIYTFNNYREGFIDTLGGGKLLDWRYYPLEDYKHTIRKTDIREMNAELGVKYKFLKELLLTVKCRYQYQKTESSLLQDRNSYYTRNLINSFSQIDYSQKKVRHIVPLGGIQEITNNQQYGRDLRGQLDFNKEFNKHAISTMAGAQINEVVTRGNTFTNYGYDEDTYSNAGVDFINAYPHFITGITDNIPGIPTQHKTSILFISTYIKTSYTYNNRYNFTISGRRDATNIFGVHTNDKWKPLWSSGLNWIISNEPFYHVGQLPYLKLRFTYGRSGNVDPKKVAITTIRYEGQNTALNTPFARIDNWYDPLLRWEQVSMLNAGLDFRMKKGRLYGSIEFYRKSMTDLYGESIVDVTTGLGRDIITRNTGKMRGKGMDVELNSINIEGKFKWSSNLIVNMNKDEIIKIRDKEKPEPALMGGAAVGLKGYPVYAYFAYRSGGLDHITGDPQGYLHGSLSKAYSTILDNTNWSDLTYVGGLLPIVSGSLGNSFSWNGLTLTARITCKLGYYFRKTSINYEHLRSLLKGHADYAERWQQPGDELFTTVPSAKYADAKDRDLFYTLSSALAVKGDHIRLQYIHLSYDLKTPRPVELYAVLDNVGVLWKANKEDIDPDYPEMKAPASFSAGIRVFF